MLQVCPRCGRLVANDETLVRVNGVWYPTACGHRLGVPDDVEQVTNHLHFYVGIQDGPKRGLLMGPYPSYDEAKSNILRAKKLAHDANPAQAGFAAYGLCSSNEVFKTVFEKGEPCPPSTPARSSRKRPRGTTTRRGVTRTPA
jgi:hypothetical protein